MADKNLILIGKIESEREWVTLGTNFREEKE